MANEQTENICQHTGCNCRVAAGEQYCSPHCEAAPTEVFCGCGHANCATSVAAQTV